MDTNRGKLQVRLCFAFCLFSIFVLCTGFVDIKTHTHISSSAMTEDIENTYTDKQGLIFSIREDEDYCTLIGHTDEVPFKLVIPGEIMVSGSSCKVKGISSQALADCSELYELEIPNEIKEIAPDAFTDCIDLKKIRIIPSKWNEKKSGKTAIVSMKVNTAGLPEDVNTEVVVTQDFLKKAIRYKDIGEIRLTFKMEEKGNYPNLVFGKKAVKMLRSSKKNLTFHLVDFKGKASIIKIKAEEVKTANGNPAFSFNEITAEDDYGAADKNIKKALKKNGINKRNIRVFRYNSAAEVRPSMKIGVPKGSFSSRGKYCYIYRYISAEGKFIQAGIEPSTKVYSDWITFPVLKNGVYIITKKPLKSMVKKLSNEFVKDSGDIYYVDQKGNVFYGWIKRGENYYYLDRKTGKMAKAAKVDGVKLRLDGTAVKTSYSTEKIDVMIKARKIVDMVTDANDSKEEKMRKTFYWVSRYPYRRFRTLQSVYKVPGWEMLFANDIFDRKMGSCTSDAAAVAFLFKECGCEEVYIASEFKHSWTEYNGRVYDAYFARTKEYPRYYNVPYESFWVKPTYKKQV